MDIDRARIFGHRETTGRLEQLARNGRVPQTLLFHGPEGIGKQRVAELFAARLLCNNPGADAAPCGACPSCRALTSDTHPDLHSIAPEASGKSVNALKTIRLEQVRELKTELARVPKLSRRRVAIIDDAHLMNAATANSLLKTLEEPTGDVVFILVTAARQALPITIVSRCLQLRFSPLTQDEMSSFLASQGIDAAIRAGITALAEGSPGQAMRLIEGDALAHRDAALEFLKGLPTLRTLDVWKEGERLGALSREECAAWLRCLRLIARDLLVICNGGDPLQTDRRKELAALLSAWDEAHLVRLMALLAQAEERALTSNANLRLLIEGLLLKTQG